MGPPVALDLHMLKSGVRSVILFILLSMGCKSSPPPAELTQPEIAILDSLQFDRSIAIDVKTITKQTFKRMRVSNVTGKDIPAHMLPRMILFKVDQNFEASLLDDSKEKGRRLGYNIYAIDQDDGHLTIIVSKVKG